jgi:Tol biopolymer transport system component/DNA-binding winged helix-turn-helix (wHTH) protein
MQSLSCSKYRFDNFELDIVRRRLLRDGNPVTLNPKAFDMLRVLVENNGALVTKEDLFRLVWEDQIVEESNLTVNMSAIRKALGEKANEPRYITTVSGRGYSFWADLQGDAVDVLVESRSLSRIVIEDEEETGPYQLPDSTTPTEDDASKRSYQAAGFRKPILLAGGAILLVVCAAVLFWYFASRGQRSLLPFQTTSVKRLTTSGRITNGAISPDGKLFAYSQEETDGRSTLLLEHVDGSGRVEIRPPLSAAYTSITFTPDGSRIYFGVIAQESSESGTYRMPAFGGAPEKIKDGFWNRISFSPDGSQFAFVTFDQENKSWSLRIADVPWNNEREIASRPGSQAFVGSTVDWSPEGSRIVVSAVNDETTQKQDLQIVDLRSGTAMQLTHLNWDGIKAVSWLNDGDGLIATAGSHDVGWDTKLWHISEADGRARRIVSDLNSYGIAARLSADKKSLLTVQAQHFSNIWVAPADDLSAARQLTFDMIGSQNGWFGVEWLPDGRILYTSYRNNSETIWVMDSNGENQRQIIPDGGRNYSISASADGRLISFESDRSGTDEIWVANSDGRGMRPLTTGGNNYQPHISPDGKWIIYRSSRDGVASLWRVSTDSAEPPTRFTHHNASWARISPDGRSVASHCFINSRSQLCIFSPSGGEPVRQFDVPPRANFRLGVHWTPDGTAVTYRDWIRGIWSQNLAGGEPVRLEGLPDEKLFAYGWSLDGKQFAFSRGKAIQDLVLITSED